MISKNVLKSDHLLLEELGKLMFRPLQGVVNGGSQEKTKFNETMAPTCISLAFVPRQKFFLANFDDKKVCECLPRLV